MGRDDRVQLDAYLAVRLWCACTLASLCGASSRQSVNSSDLVDGTGESSWNSQDDELSDEGSGERLQQEEDDEEDAEDDDDDEEEEEENAAEQGAKDARSGIREPLGRGGGAGGAGHEADAPRKVGSSRRANN